MIALYSVAEKPSTYLAARTPRVQLWNHTTDPFQDKNPCYINHAFFSLGMTEGACMLLGLKTTTVCVPMAGPGYSSAFVSLGSIKRKGVPNLFGGREAFL